MLSEEPRNSNDNPSLGYHQNYNTSTTSTTGSYISDDNSHMSINLVNAPDNSLVQCDCGHINCPMCNLMMNLELTEPTWNQNWNNIKTLHSHIIWYSFELTTIKLMFQNLFTYVNAISSRLAFCLTILNNY